MATFYPQLLLNESWTQQWQRHLRNKNIINNINDIVRNQTNDYKYIIENSSRELSSAIQESTDAICDTIEDGFSYVNEHLYNLGVGIEGIRSELSSLSSMLDWKLSLLVEQQRISNLLLGNISILLRIPDIQKERHYHIEQGIKFLKNAFFDSDFYKDSLSNLLKSEQIEPTDYFTLHRIGLIYLYSPFHLDLAKSEYYFRKAAKYAVAETNSGAVATKNYLAYDLDKSLNSQIPPTDAIKLQAAESYLFAGRSCYLQKKLVDAADLAGKAFDLVPGFLEAGFEKAKALAANNNESKAAMVLEKVINSDRYYSLKVITDLDLCPKRSIQLLLKKLQKEAYEQTLNLFRNCKRNIIAGSNASAYLNIIENLLNKNKYLTSKKAYDLLINERDWDFCAPYKNQNQIKYFKELTEIAKSFSDLKFYNSDPITAKINMNTQWNFPASSAIQSNSKWVNDIRTKAIKCNIIYFIEAEKRYFDNLPSFIGSIKSLLQEAYELETLQIKGIRRKKRNANNQNAAASFGMGIVGGGIGAVVGFVAGFILAFLLGLGSCFRGEASHGDYTNMVIIIVAIGIVLGFIIGFFNKRKKIR